MTDVADTLRAAGTSPEAIRHHYDLSEDFFKIWLGDELVYSCGLWQGGNPADRLDNAQSRKLDFFATALGVRGARVLDVGCGWGALLDRFVREHGSAGGVGITLSPTQAAYAEARAVPGVEYRLQHWADHQPREPYDVVTCVEATEHFASDTLDVAAKVDVYRAFFARAASWLRDGGRLGLQLICLDNVGHEGSRPGRGPVSRVIGTEIFPVAMPASLAELAVAWETEFRLDVFDEHTDHYRRTFRAWALALRAQREQASDLVGPERVRTFERYFAAGEACFRLREHALYRVLLTRRPQPKSWLVAPMLPVAAASPLSRDEGASGAAVRSHYDLSNGFYRMWLGPTMMYSSAMWSPGQETADLDDAHAAKIDFFAQWTVGAQRVLDVGCGWGGTLRRLHVQHGVQAGVGLTLSPAQQDWIADDPIPGSRIALQSWGSHEAASPYDAIFSFGAFEHFARPGTTSAERMCIYQQFFARCFDWLIPGGHLGLETIAHDQAPDTAPQEGRGPQGDAVVDLFPESVCPQLCEVVAGFEPWFEMVVLRSDAADFARTFRAWSVALRGRAGNARALVGDDVARRYRRYLISSEMQFRSGALTNYRLVLRRRAAMRW